MSMCNKAMKAASANEAMYIHAYKTECLNAVASLIGYKSTGAIKAVKKAFLENKTKGNALRLKAAQRRYDEHAQLFDLLVSDMMKNAKENGYDKNIVNPIQMIEDWQLVLAKHLRGEINPITIMQGERTVKATTQLVVRTIKQRNKWLKKGKIPKSSIFGSPPEMLLSKADRFGFSQRLIKRALTLSDRDISITSKYASKISSARQKMTDKLSSLIKYEGNRPKFNLNKISMWGLQEEGDFAFRLKGSDDDILIVGESIINNEQYFKIKKEDGKIENVPASELNASRSDVEKAIIALYRDELTNEIMDGQSRLIIPSVLNKEIETIVDEQTDRISDKVDVDFERAKAKVRQMSEEKAEGDDKGNRVPGVHEVRYTEGKKTWIYRYFMVKQGEGKDITSNDPKATNQESYKAYLLDKVQVGTTSPTIESTRINYVGKTYELISGGEVTEATESVTQQEVDKIFGKQEGQDGVWYRSTQVNDFGRRMNPKDGEPLMGTHTKQYVNFQRMENAPSEDLMPFVWNLVSDLREQMNLVWDDLQYKMKRVERGRTKYVQSITKRMKKKGQSDSEIDAYLQKMSNIGGLDTRIQYQKNKNTGEVEIRTANTFAKKKRENYVPHMYTYESIMEQIKKQIKALETKIIRANEMGDAEAVENYKLGQDHLREMLQSLGKNDLSTKMLDLQNIPFMKHITSWTNQVERRKDADIYEEYLNHAYRNLHRNEIIVDLLKSVDSLSRVDVPGGTIRYLTNRIKMAFGDSDTRSMTVLGREGGYQKTAEFINKFPKWMRGGVTFDAAAAEKMTKWFTTPSTIRYLGANPALGNQTQILNQIIQVGFKTATKAYKLSKTKHAEKIVQNTGVLNVLNMFADIMSVDGDPKWNDFLFVPGIKEGFGVSVVNPIQVKEFLKIINMGRKAFINNDNDAIDLMLMRMEMRAQGKSRQTIREMQNLRKMRREIGDAALKEKRGQLFDYYTLDKKASKELVEQRFRALVGDMADSQIKKWVTWKLSWWFDEAGGAGKGVFTFTEGEKSLRSMTVLMAVVHAMDKGMLPVSFEKALEGESLDVLTSDLAKKIARDAVYNTQFGMTPMYLGEGFNGIGRLIFQYKQYPTLQSIYDYQTFKKFSDGNYGAIDGVGRMTRAIFQAGKQGWVKDKTKTYDPKAKDIDHEALAMVRFLFTRFTASFIGSIISLIPFLGRILRANGTGSFGILRSGESPALGLVMRLAVWTSIANMNGDDDGADEAVEEIFENLKFLLMPVLLSFFLQEIEGVLDITED